MAGALYTETLFKKGSIRFSFMEQQFWLYFYSSIVALVIHHSIHPYYYLDRAIIDVMLGKCCILGVPYFDSHNNCFLDLDLVHRQLFFLALFCSSFVGLIVAW